MIVLLSFPEVESIGPGKGLNLDLVKHRILGAETFVSLRNLNAGGPFFIVDPLASRNQVAQATCLMKPYLNLYLIILILFFCILCQDGWQEGLQQLRQGLWQVRAACDARKFWAYTGSASLVRLHYAHLVVQKKRADQTGNSSSCDNVHGRHLIEESLDRAGSYVSPIEGQVKPDFTQDPTDSENSPVPILNSDFIVVT